MEIKYEKIITPEKIIPKKISEQIIYIAIDGTQFKNKDECEKYEIKYKYDILKKIRPLPEEINGITINDLVFDDIIYINNEDDINTIADINVKRYKYKFSFNENRDFHGAGYYVSIYTIDYDYREEIRIYRLISIKEYIKRLSNIYNWYNETFNSIV